ANLGSRAKNSYCTSIKQILVILLWDHTSNNYHNIVSTIFFQCLYNLWDKCFMSSSKRGYAKNMDIVFHSLFSCFFWGLEKRTYINIKTNICISCCYYFGTSIMTILSHFGNHDSRSPSILFCKYVSQLLGFAK